MADVANRDELERRLSRALGRELSSTLRDILDKLGDPPDALNIPPDFWETRSQAIRNAIEPVLRDAFAEQSDAVQSNLSIGLDLDLVNTAAANWAQSYTYELVNNLTTTRIGKLQQYISDYYKQGLTIGDLEAKLQPWFHGRNAARIAITEVTRAAANGELATSNSIMQQTPEIVIDQVWQTSNDEMVCPICGPRHNKVVRDGEYPPAHPNCRCWLTQKVRLVKK